MIGSLVKWHINLCGLHKTILVEEQQWYYLTHGLENKGVHAFSLDISLKMNMIAWLEFELTSFNTTDQYFSHYAMGTPLASFEITMIFFFITSSCQIH